jgi:hypothetical protein
LLSKIQTKTKLPGKAIKNTSKNKTPWQNNQKYKQKQNSLAKQSKIQTKTKLPGKAIKNTNKNFEVFL